ncbi:MAG: hypothetical protein SXV54_16445 [Chloroflexota bacterium]|nr:hypothetical protein [Chloroflexota bacterium]
MHKKQILVVFHSSAGNTNKVAQAIAEALSADLEQIQEVTPRPVDIKGRSWGNFLNMGRVVFAAIRRRSVPIHDAQRDPADYDLTLVGTPVYAGSLPGPTRAYLERYGARCQAVAFFCTGEDPRNERIFELMEAACAKSPLAVRAFHTPEIRAGEFQSQVEAFASQFDGDDG